MPGPGLIGAGREHKGEIMTNRKRAIELAENAIEQIENGSISPDTQDLMAYALILVLAEIAEQLKGTNDRLEIMAHALGYRG